MELRLRTAAGTRSTRPGHTADPPGHVDELLDGMAESRRWGLNADLVHVVDREADSVGHYRQWQTAGHRFVVRAKADRVVTHEGVERSLGTVVGRLGCQFEPVRGAGGAPRGVAIGRGTGVLKVAEAGVVLHRPARRRTGDGTRVDVPGPPIPLRLVVTRVVNALGVVLAEWLLFTNVPAGVADAGAVGTWYAWRWRVEKSQADYPSSRRWVGDWRIGYHRRDGVARTGHVVPAAPGRLHRRNRMSDTTRRSAPPRA
jgi:hypothetical protein